MLKKIFFPQCCTGAPPGILIGSSNDDNTILYIVAVVHFPVTPRSLNSYLAKYDKVHTNVREDNHVNLVPLGTWFPINSSEKKNDDFSRMVPKLFGQNTWISIQANKNIDGAIVFTAEDLVTEQAGPKNIFGGSEYTKRNTDIILVIYNQKDIWDGEFSDESVLKEDSSGAIEDLFAVTSACKNGILSYESGLSCDDGVSVTHCCVQRELSLVFYLLTIFFTVLLGCIYLMVHYIKNVFTKVCKEDSFIFKIWDKLTELSSFLSHIERRFSHLGKSILRLFGEKSKTERDKKGYEDHDLIASIFVDMVFGSALLWSLHYFGFLPSSSTTKEVLLPYVDSIASQVEELIKWLMGIPAGLKLNHPLNQFLGHFFMYHVRLWLEYAKMMMDLFPHLITYCLLSSCLGLSFLLSIIADGVSTLSFHVYCFYVYAGRLYGLQVAGLTSLWRLFRGKKWNPLRKRVDSLEESGQRADQLFAGTLLFTVLFFLLPTTALYYGIFMLLRVAVLAIQVILSGLIFMLSEFPWYTMTIRILQPHKFIKSMKCTMLDTILQQDTQNSIVQHEVNQAIVLNMSVQPKLLGSVVSSALYNRRQHSKERTGLKTFLRKIIFGELIRWT